MPPTRDEIVAIVAEEARIDPAKLSPDATLAALGIASLDVVSALFAIEDRFGVEIAPEEVATASSFGEFVDIVEARVAEA